MPTGVQRDPDEPGYENRHSCFIHRSLSQDKIPAVRRQNAKRLRISWDGRASVRAYPMLNRKICLELKVGSCRNKNGTARDSAQKKGSVLGGGPLEQGRLQPLTTESPCSMMEP